MKFIKLSATGNDFIVINNLNLAYKASDTTLWKKLCERRKNIGADGVLLVEPSQVYDFKMRYINADGGEVSMCGNGGRAISYYFYNHINSDKKNLTFETMNGVYKSFVESEYLIKLEMTELSELDQIDISSLFLGEKSLYLNTGVPHCVFETKNINELDILQFKITT